MAVVIAFDVNETLLDLRALDPLFADALGDAALRPAWFAAMLQLSFVGGLTGNYVDFTTAQQRGAADDRDQGRPRNQCRPCRPHRRCDAAAATRRTTSSAPSATPAW